MPMTGRARRPGRPTSRTARPSRRPPSWRNCRSRCSSLRWRRPDPCRSPSSRSSAAASVQAETASESELDPLRRFDDSGLLLQRTRHLSLALWRLQDRLGRPATSLDALHWRLHGAFGPLAIAEGLVRAAEEQRTIPGEAHFLLAELALTVAGVDWSHVAAGIDLKAARTLVADVLAAIEDRRVALPPAPDPALDAYVRDALEEARR